MTARIPILPKSFFHATVLVALVSFSFFSPNALAIVAPDFTLTDENANSVRYKQSISPRDYRQYLSVWYFGAST